ncbi:hypothetical protein C8Q72DRAFT_555541 [Fomitopsis betulina]|nr:hypothetical protein C8Q72DRAFT_555541 [Fomitopsis betulina]
MSAATSRCSRTRPVYTQQPVTVSPMSLASSTHIASTWHHVYQPSAVLGNLIAGRKVEDTPLLVLVRDDSVREDMVNYDIFGCTWLLRDHAKRLQRGNLHQPDTEASASMSQTDIQIIYYIWAPNSTAADSAPKFKAAMDEHVAWIKGCAATGTVLYGGAILINDQKLPITTEPETAGLTYVIKADNLEAARTFFEQDPWFKAGAYDNANIKIAPMLSKA